MVMEGYQRGAWCLGSGQGLDCDTGVFMIIMITWQMDIRNIHIE